MKTTVYLMHKLQLLDGVYTPSEASSVINSMIMEKVNFHKIHALSLWEGDHEVDASNDYKNVEELLKEKENFKILCQTARIEGKRLKVSCALDFELVD